MFLPQSYKAPVIPVRTFTPEEEAERLKYFKPDIEDICVGYECRVVNTYFLANEWGYEHTLSPMQKLTREDVITRFKTSWNVRVRKLEKEAICDEGWQIVTPDSSKWIKKNIFYFEKDNYFLIADFNHPVPFLQWILRDPSLMLDKMPNVERWSVCLNVRCINDFRKIVKML